MTDQRRYTIADLRTIVPASTPAWIRIIEAYNVEEEDESHTKEWSDEVIPVLAYATLPEGEGAFLIYDNTYPYTSGGPTWATQQKGGTSRSKIRIELSVGSPPTKGTPCNITKGHTYVPTQASPLELVEVLCWIL